MPDVDEIITGLRVERAWSADQMTTMVPLDSAEAAVVAAVDARTAEIVKWLRTTKGDEWMRGQDAARSVVSRFNGGES
jgi:hypothetical protein